VIVRILNVSVRLAGSFLSLSRHACCFFVVRDVGTCKSKAFLKMFAIIRKHASSFQLAGFANNLAHDPTDFRVKVQSGRSLGRYSISGSMTVILGCECNGMECKGGGLDYLRRRRKPSGLGTYSVMTRP
jgi:hypothetical protein